MQLSKMILDEQAGLVSESSIFLIRSTSDFHTLSSYLSFKKNSVGYIPIKYAPKFRLYTIKLLSHAPELQVQ